MGISMALYIIGTDGWENSCGILLTGTYFYRLIDVKRYYWLSPSQECNIYILFCYKNNPKNDHRKSVFLN